MIKYVLDHVVNGPTVGRIESAGCLAGLFALCSGIDCIQIEKLTDTAHANKQGWVFVLRRHRCFAKPFCAFLKIRGGLVIPEEEKLRVKIAAQIVVGDQLLYCLNHELAAGQPRFMVGCECCELPDDAFHRQEGQQLLQAAAPKRHKIRRSDVEEATHRGGLACCAAADAQCAWQVP